MKLDVNVLRYLGKDDFRTLTAVRGLSGLLCLRLSSSTVALVGCGEPVTSPGILPDARGIAWRPLLATLA